MFYFTALCKLEWGLRWNEDKNVFISPHYYSVHKLYPCLLKYPRAVLNQHFHESLTMFWQRNINCRPGVLNPPPSNRLFTLCLRFCNILPFEDWKIVAAFQKLLIFCALFAPSAQRVRIMGWARPCSRFNSTASGRIWMKFGLDVVPFCATSKSWFWMFYDPVVTHDNLPMWEGNWYCRWLKIDVLRNFRLIGFIIFQIDFIGICSLI